MEPNLTQQMEQAVAVLRRGGIVAYPTDTVYGLGASMNDAAAVRKVFEAKERPFDMALPLLLSGEEQLGMVTPEVSPVFHLLSRTFWPGALTLVVKRSSGVPDMVTAGGGTVAVRVPGHPVPRELARELGAPITGTSANRSGLPSPVTAEEVEEQLGGKVDFIIDGGRCEGGIESTILDVTGEKVRILREGAVSRAELEKLGINLA